MPVGSTSGPPFAARLVRDVPAERAAPWAVLALALFLRLWHIDLTRFSNEAVWLLQATNDFIKTGHIPLHSGLAFSVGAWAPPLITFLLAPLVIVSRDPLWISAGLSALDAFGSVFVFWGARRLTSSTWAGMAAGLAYAAAPAALIYGRMVWNVTLVPGLSAVALWGLIEFWMQRRSLALAVALVAIGAAAQLHVVNGIYGVLWLTVAVAGWKYVRWCPLAAAAALLIGDLCPARASRPQGCSAHGAPRSWSIASCASSWWSMPASGASAPRKIVASKPAKNPAPPAKNPALNFSRPAPSPSRSC